MIDDQRTEPEELPGWARDHDEKVLDAFYALAEVLLDPWRGNYEPATRELTDALERLQMDATCGDCVEGRCHWGGQASRDSIAAVAAGVEYPDQCGCARHEDSVRWRDIKARIAAVNAAWTIPAGAAYGLDRFDRRWSDYVNFQPNHWICREVSAGSQPFAVRNTASLVIDRGPIRWHDADGTLLVDQADSAPATGDGR